MVGTESCREVMAHIIRPMMSEDWLIVLMEETNEPRQSRDPYGAEHHFVTRRWHQPSTVNSAATNARISTKHRETIDMVCAITS